MKKIMMALGFVMVLIFSAAYVHADNPEHKGMGEMGRSHQGWKSGKEYSFTPEQRAKFRELRRNFRRDNAQLIGSLVAKKIELQALWSDPKADSKAIMDKTKELRGVQDQLREKFVGMILEARNTLTPEQIAHLKPGWMWGRGHRHGRMMGFGEMEHRPMMGHGGMMGHGEMMEQGGMMQHEKMMEHGHGKCS